MKGSEYFSLYSTWNRMKYRCYNPNYDRYKYYGGKGVRVCDEWLNDYAAFKEWAIANGYRKGLTIDRKDPDGDYEPNNCQWLTLEDNIKKMHSDKRRKTK